MTAPDPAHTLRSAVEAIVPGPNGAVDAGAHDVVLETLDRIGGDEAVGGCLLVLDGYAASVRPEARFADLDVSERGEVLRRIASDENEDLRSLARLLFSLTVAVTYGERSGLGSGGRLVERPASWDEIGYPGPSTGYELGRRV